MQDTAPCVSPNGGDCHRWGWRSRSPTALRLALDLKSVSLCSLTISYHSCPWLSSGGLSSVQHPFTSLLIEGDMQTGSSSRRQSKNLYDVCFVSVVCPVAWHTLRPQLNDTKPLSPNPALDAIMTCQSTARVCALTGLAGCDRLFATCSTRKLHEVS